jgi:ATP-dependent DNA helicase RecG
LNWSGPPWLVSSRPTPSITPAIEARLNERQKRIILHVQEDGEVTSGWCRKEFGIAYDTANRDLLELVEVGLLVRVGQGRGTRFQFTQLRS